VGPASTLAHPSKSGFGAGVRAYSASKLCNLLTAQSLAALDEVKARQITVIAVSPGLPGGTSLSRDGSRARRAFVMLLMHRLPSGRSLPSRVRQLWRESAAMVGIG
jgi:NAD(P)-dependent dehydrogenase (short-subunit alcohol dehydrogenase family)